MSDNSDLEEADIDEGEVLHSREGITPNNYKVLHSNKGSAKSLNALVRENSPVKHGPSSFSSKKSNFNKKNLTNRTPDPFAKYNIDALADSPKKKRELYFEVNKKGSSNDVRRVPINKGLFIHDYSSAGSD